MKNRCLEVELNAPYAEKTNMKPPLNIRDREFLIWLRDSAEEIASQDLNPHWIRTYFDLADAADRLDAMHARSQVHQYEQGRPLEIGTECGLAPVVDIDGGKGPDCTAPNCDCDEKSGCKNT